MPAKPSIPKKAPKAAPRKGPAAASEPAGPMVPEPAAPRKPKRWLLYTPFALIAAALVAYGAYWLVAKSRLEAGLEARAEALTRAGYQVALENRRVDGFPFRMRITYGAVRLASASGWAFEAPRLEAQAYLHNLGHWVVVAPDGVTVVRPRGGPLQVRGDALRASVAGLGRAPPRIILEAVKPVFTPGPAALPFSLASADRLEIGLRPAPDGSADAQAGFSLTGGKAVAGTVVGRLAADKPVTATIDARVVKPAGFKGASWGEAVRAWAAGGGQVQLQKAEAQGDTTAVWARGGTLTVGSDGRLSGSAPLEMRQGPQGLATLAESGVNPDAARTAAAVAAARDQGGSASLNLVFQAGVVTLGPVQIGPSPRIY